MFQEPTDPKHKGLEAEFAEECRFFDKLRKRLKEISEETRLKNEDAERLGKYLQENPRSKQELNPIDDATANAAAELDAAEWEREQRQSPSQAETNRQIRQAALKQSESYIQRLGDGLLGWEAVLPLRYKAAAYAGNIAHQYGLSWEEAQQSVLHGFSQLAKAKANGKKILKPGGFVWTAIRNYLKDRASQVAPSKTDALAVSVGDPVGISDSGKMHYENPGDRGSLVLDSERVDKRDRLDTEDTGRGFVKLSGEYGWKRGGGGYHRRTRALGPIRQPTESRAVRNVEPFEPTAVSRLRPALPAKYRHIPTEVLTELMTPEWRRDERGRFHSDEVVGAYLNLGLGEVEQLRAQVLAKLNGQRAIPIRECACGCGKLVLSSRPDALYATPACRKRGSRRGASNKG